MNLKVSRLAVSRYFKHFIDFTETEESRHIPSTFDSGFVPFVPSQHEPNPFQHHQHHHIDESHESEFFPAHHDFVDRKYYSPFHTMPTVRPTGQRVFGRFQSQSTTSTRRPIYQDQEILGSGDFVVMKGIHSTEKATSDLRSIGQSFITVAMMDDLTPSHSSRINTIHLPTSEILLTSPAMHSRPISPIKFSSTMARRSTNRTTFSKNWK